MGQPQDRTVLGVLPKVIGGDSRNVVTEQPLAVITWLSDTEERVEVGRLTVVGDRDQGTIRASGYITWRTLDRRQVRLEGHAFIICIVVLACQRAGETDRGGMQPGVAVGPDRLVGHAVKTGVGVNTA